MTRGTLGFLRPMALLNEKMGGKMGVIVMSKRFKLRVVQVVTSGSAETYAVSRSYFGKVSADFSGIISVTIDLVPVIYLPHNFYTLKNVP